MTDRELFEQALDALEHLQTDVEWQYKSPTRAMLRKIEKALRARLAEPPKDVELPLVRPAEFVKLIQGKENYWGRSVMRTAWPMPEPTIDSWPLPADLPPVKLQDYRETPPESWAQSATANGMLRPEPMIDGWPLWSGLPQVPQGGGGVSEEMLKKVVDKLPTMPIKVAENPTKPTKVMLIPALLEQAGYVKKKEWVGLTNEVYEAMAEQYVTNCYFDTLKYAKAIEAKLKDNNYDND